MKALFFHHPYNRPRFEQDFLDRVAALPEFELVPADLNALADGRIAGPNGDISLDRYDAVLVFVAFNPLRRAPELKWRGFEGLRIFYENDAVQNYSDIFDPALFGTWPPVFRHHRFDMMLTSGRAVRDRLRNDGIKAEWIAKAYEPRRFRDLDGARAGIVTYGSQYRCREIAERAIVEAGLPLERIPMTPYVELGILLARYLACMAVSSDLLVPVAQRPALDKVPARSVPMRPGLEPMAKFFEAAGAGCCPIADAMDDLDALGFEDGKTAVTYATHDELVEKLRNGFDRPKELREIGRAAARLARAKHTWAHRAVELRDTIARCLQGRAP